MFIRLAFFALSLALVGCSSSISDPALELAQMKGISEEYRLKLERESLHNPTDPLPAYKLAWLLHQQGDNQAAWPMAQKALNLAPLAASYRLLAGQIQQDLGDHFQAVNLLSSALKLDDRLLAGYLALAKSLEATGRHSEAANQLKTAIQIEPLFFDARLAWVRTQLGIAGQTPQTNQVEALSQELESALTIKPGSKEGTLLLASLYEEQGASLRARLLLENWLSRFGDDDLVLLQLARLLFQGQQPKTAAAILSRQKKQDAASYVLKLQLESPTTSPAQLLSQVTEKLKTYPQSLDLHLFKARLMLQLGQIDHAERVLQSTLSIEPKSIDAYLLLARVYAEQSDYTGEEQALKTAHQLAPQSPTVRIAQVESWMQKGLYAKAQAALNQSSPLSQNRKVLLLRAALSLYQGDFSQTETWIKRAQKQGEDEASQLALARLEIAQGLNETAIHRLKKILRAAPENFDAKLTLAQAYLKTGQDGRLEALLKPLKAIKRGFGRVHLLLSRSLINRGLLPAAASTLSDGLRTWPRQPELAQLYTATLGFLGRYNQAIPILEEMQHFTHRYSQLFRYRLWEYYQKAGKTKQFRQYPLPLEF